jgi:hypothetical protein
MTVDGVEGVPSGDTGNVVAGEQQLPPAGSQRESGRLPLPVDSITTQAELGAPVTHMADELDDERPSKKARVAYEKSPTPPKLDERRKGVAPVKKE